MGMNSFDVWRRFANGKGPLSELARPVPMLSGLSYLATYVLIAGAIWLGVWADHLGVTLFCVLFIGARQHTLYVLNHGASHGNLFGHENENRWAAFVFSVLPFFHHPKTHSFVQWRRQHQLHHRYLLTARDLDYQSRVRAGDTQKNYTSWTLLQDLVYSAVKTAAAFFFGRNDYVRPDGTFVVGRDAHLTLLLRPVRDDPDMEHERRIKLGVYLVALPALLVICPGPFLTYWLLPMYTVYPVILRLMDLTEHDLQASDTDVLSNSRSTAPGPLGEVLVGAVGRSFHREHHLFPRVPFFRLKALSQVLCSDLGLPNPNNGFSGLLGVILSGRRQPKVNTG